MKQTSIRKRILIWFLLLQGLLAASGLVGVLLYARRQQSKAFDAELRGQMFAVLARTENQNGKLELVQPELVPADHLFLLRDSGGRTIASSGTERFLSATVMRQPASFDSDGRHYRGALWRSVPLSEEESVHPGVQATVDLLYAMPTTAIDSRFRRLELIAASVCLGFLVLSALATWWAIRKGLSPLNELAERAAQIDVEHWHFEVPAKAAATSELVPLGNALTQLITRLKSAFERERTFVSDAGHELKTAVAIQKSTLQLLEQGDASASGYKQGIGRALEDTRRMERLVSSMLRLASIESSGEVAPSVSILLDSLTVAIADLSTMAEKLDVKISVTGLYLRNRVFGDVEELAVVWRNVIENALQHSPPGAEISIDVHGATDGALEVCIADSGPGVAAQDLPHVFERFYRADHSRSRSTGGFGLGLAIAKSLVERNRGSIEMRSVLGKGACVVVRLSTPIARISGNGAAR